MTIGTNTQPATTNSPKNLSKTVEKPFTKLYTRTWLYGRPEDDVYKLLIDCFRLREEDEYVFGGNVLTGSIYCGDKTSKVQFDKFLDEAEAAEKNILPPWWSSEKREACVALEMDDRNWSSLATCVEKHDIQDHYGNQDMPMQLRMLADQIYGSNPLGYSSEGILRMRMMMEGGASQRTVQGSTREALPLK